MRAASDPVQRRATSKLLRLDATGEFTHATRFDLPRFIERGDVIVANDAATLPASLAATHVRTGERIEIRLAARRSLNPDDVLLFDAIVFGAGNFRTRTEERPLPPTLQVGDRLVVGSIHAVIDALLHHPRFVRLRFAATPADVWRTFATRGRPIQYAHLNEPLQLWDVWTPFAANPVAYEAPSAGFALDWALLERLHARGAQFVTLTHAAGISSTGDAELDQRLPLDEPYLIPEVTARAIRGARERGSRVIAIGTTVVRALEAAAINDCCVRAGHGLATQRIGPSTHLRIVDAMLSGTHEAGTSHYELLRAFTADEVLRRMSAELETHNYLTHEFGDAVFIEADHSRAPLRRGSVELRVDWAMPRRSAELACAACD